MNTNRHTLSRRQMLAGTAAIATFAATASCRSNADEANAWRQVDAAAERMITDRLTPGVSISVMRDGEFLYSEGHGLANIETNAPMTQDSVFKIASITKQMTAAALLLLQEDGALSLSDKLSKYIPDFPRSDEITLRQLATHTAGLGDYGRLPTRSNDQSQEYDDEGFLALLKRTDPLFVAEPGTEENYSNTDYGLLGLIINQVSGTHYSRLFQSRLFEPSGLKHTAYDHQFEVVPNRVSGYSPWQQMPSGFANGDYIASSYPGPSGAVRSTSADLCRWHNALVFGDLLSAESRSEMVAHVSLPDSVSHYGLGVLTKFPRDPFKGRTVVSHGGRISGFAADLWSFPDKGVTVATLCNSDGGDQSGFGKGFDSVRDPATLIALNEI